MPFVRRSSWPRDWTHISCSFCVAGELFTTEPPGKPAFLFVVVQLLSCVRPFVTPWTTAHQALLSFSISRSWLKLMSIESVLPSNHLTFWRPLLLLPSIFPSRYFPMSWLFASGDQSIGTSASASVLPMNIQDWFPLGLAGLISLNSKGLSGVFSSSTIQKHQFLCTQPSLGSSSYICTWISGKTPLF